MGAAPLAGCAGCETSGDSSKVDAGVPIDPLAASGSPASSSSDSPGLRGGGMRQRFRFRRDGAPAPSGESAPQASAPGSAH